jgi:hypothetical protein
MMQNSPERLQQPIQAFGPMTGRKREDHPTEPPYVLPFQLTCFKTLC